MSVFVACPSCSARLGVPDSFSSGIVTCPKCGARNRFTRRGAARPVDPTCPTQGISRPAPFPASPPSRPITPSFLFDDLEEPEKLPPVPSVPNRAMRSYRQPNNGKPKSTLTFILVAGGGLGFLMAGLLAFLVSHHKNQDVARSKTEGKQNVDNSYPVESDSVGALLHNGQDGTDQNRGIPNFSTDSQAIIYRRGPLPKDRVVEVVSAATVYIKVKIDGRDHSFGSGFVIRNSAGKTYVATNRHVVSSQTGGRTSRGENPRTNQAISVACVFRSGIQGKEQELSAKILAADASGDPTRDLAVLSCENVNQPPDPISFTHDEPKLGTPLLMFGYPFGAILNVARSGNPPVTLNRASVSQLEPDQSGDVAMLKVDGNLDPGNSGGPIVDDAGQLVGVAVGKSSLADGIGFVIPRSRLEQLLAGRVARVDVQLVSVNNGKYEFEVSADITDPMGQLTSAQIRVAPLYGDLRKPELPNKIEEIPDAKPAPLLVDHQAGVAKARVSVPMAAAPNHVVVQFSSTSRNGMKSLSAPTPHSLPQQPGRLLAVGDHEAVTDRIDDMLTGAFKKLQDLVDQNKDCKLVKERDAIKIEVPPGCHTLLPVIADKNSGLNAPRTLAKVEGDFVMHALIGGALNPGLERVNNPRTNRPLDWSFQSAGLLLWEDDKNFIRLERTASVMRRGTFLEHRLLVEVYKQGKIVGEPLWFSVPEGPMHLMMLRNNGLIRCLFSPDGVRWIAFREFAADFPNRVEVGLSAANMSKKPLTAEYSDFILFDKTDAAKLEEELRKIQ